MYKITNKAIQPHDLLRQSEHQNTERSLLPAPLGTKRKEGLPPHLEYEAYPAMAEKIMERIGEEAKSKWPIGKVAIYIG